MYQLYQGDCLEIMRDIPDNSIDMVLCDPPYGINFQSQYKKSKKDWKPKILNDKKPFVEFIPMIKRTLKPDACTMIFTRWDVQQTFINALNDNGIRVKNVIIWDKVMHGMGDLKRTYASRYESILFSSEQYFRFPGKRPTDIIRERKVLPARLFHPNEKPVSLLKILIEQCTMPRDTIFDPFMGSGSTGVAALNTCRDFIGIELDQKYFQIAKERIEEAEQAIASGLSEA